MKRGKPLRRKTPLRSRGKTKYRRRPRHLDYMRDVRRLACILRHAQYAAIATSCQGRVEADHMGRRAFGQKADDRTCVPICAKHHRERTDRTGTFKGWTREAMRAFCDWAIKETQDEIAHMLPEAWEMYVYGLAATRKA